LVERIRQRLAIIKTVSSEDASIEKYVFFQDFRKRFLTLLSYKFREFGSVTALSILEAANAGVKDDSETGTTHFVSFE